MIPISVNLRSTLEQPRPLIGAVLSLSVAVFVFTCAHMLWAHLQQLKGERGDGRIVTVLSHGASSEASSRLRDEEVRLLDVLEAFAPLDASARGAAELVVTVRHPKNGQSFSLRGISQRSLALRGDTAIVSGRQLELGRDEVVVGRLAKRLLSDAGLLQGGTLDLGNGKAVPVVGEFTSPAPARDAEVWMDLQAVRAFFADAGATSSFVARLRDAGDLAGAQRQVGQDPRLDVTLALEDAVDGARAAGLALLLQGLAVLVAIVLMLASFFGAVTTLFSIVKGRQRAIGTLKALGFERHHILFGIVAELSLLALVCGLLGFAAASLLQFAPLGALSGPSGEFIAIALRPTRQTFIAAMQVSLAITALSGYMPALIAANVSPIQAIRS